jgi:homeobox protein cut-like
MEDMINDKVTAKEAELNAVYDERMRNYEERERDLTKQVAVARDQLKELRTSNESTHARLLDHNQRQGALPASRVHLAATRSRRRHRLATCRNRSTDGRRSPRQRAHRRY